MSILTRLTEAQRGEVIRGITDEAVPRASFYVLVLLSTAIASYGLLANSTAVVIGAMLIAPLMGPIYGIALGLIRDDRRLLLLASLSEVVGIALAVGLAVLIGSLPLRPEFGTVILAWTKPNLYDLLVALIAGVAGGYARTSARVSPTLPGVAIATALVPPLAASGLCLSDARWDAALGAFLLFATNLLAIEIAASVVFVLAGLAVRPAGERAPVAGLLRRFAIPAVLLIPIAAFLLNTLVALVRDDRLSRNLRRVLDEDLHSVVGAVVTDLRHDSSGGELEVVAVVMTPQAIDPAVVAATEADLRRRGNPHTHLIVRSLISRDADRTGQVFLDDELRERLRGERERQTFLNELSSGLRLGLSGVLGAELIDVQRQERDSYRIRATVRAPVVIDPARVDLMQRAAAKATGAPIQLTVRSILTRDADGRAYLDDDPHAALQQRVRDVLTGLLARKAPDADLLAVRVSEASELSVTGTIVGFGVNRPIVEELGRELSERLERPVHLMLRSVNSSRTAVRAGESGAAHPTTAR